MAKGSKSKKSRSRRRPATSKPADTKKPAETKKKEQKPRGILDVARNTSQGQRVAIATTAVILVAVAGFFGGRAGGSPTFRFDDEHGLIDRTVETKVDEAGGFDQTPLTIDVADEQFCVDGSKNNFTVAEGSCNGAS